MWTFLTEMLQDKLISFFSVHLTAKVIIIFEKKKQEQILLTNDTVIANRLPILVTEIPAMCKETVHSEGYQNNDEGSV